MEVGRSQVAGKAPASMRGWSWVCEMRYEGYMTCSRRRLQRVSSIMMLLCQAPQQNRARVPSMRGWESGPVMDVNLCSCMGPMRVCSSEGSAYGSGEWKADWSAVRQLGSASMFAGGLGVGAGAVLKTEFELNC